MRISPSVKIIPVTKKISVFNHPLLIEQVYFKSGSGHLDPKIVSVLQRKKMIVNDSKVENLIKQDIIKETNSKEFTLLRVLLTDLCNYGCKYCKVCNNIESPKSSATPLDKLYKAIDLLFKVNKKPKVIHITGGEPLIFFDSVKRIVEYVRAKHSQKNGRYIIVVGTNGLLVDEEKAAYFKKNRVKVIVSLDGKRSANILRVKRSGEASYDETVRGIKILQKIGIEFGISMVVGKHNLNKIKENILFVQRNFSPSSIGINFIKNTKINKESPYLVDGLKYADAIYSAHRSNRSIFLELLARKIFPFVQKKYRAYDCGSSSGTTINIDAEGNLGTCKSYLLLKRNETRRGMSDLIDEFRKRSPLLNPHCYHCQAQGICGNGCAYEAKHNGSDIDSRSCRYVNRFYKLFIQDLFLLNKTKAMRSIETRGYYVPSQGDRNKILGKMKKDLSSLKQCIGHET